MKPSQLKILLEESFKNQLPVLITGAPGIGKTDIVVQSAKNAECELIIEHPVVSDPTDFKGLPFASDGEADFLPFGSLKKLIKANKPTVFFLDDLGQAPPAVQAACMQLLLARRINGHKVSNFVTFVAATNRRSDKAHVSGLLEPVKSRFVTIVNLDVDLDDWVEWAINNGLPIELISFTRFRPSLLHDFKPTQDLVNTPSPRTVTNVGKLMALNVPKSMKFELFSGAAGEGFASEFVAFLEIYKNLPNPDLILMDPENAEVPEDPATLYALCGALSTKASEQNFDRLVKYYNRLPAEFNVLATRDSVKRDPEITNTKGFIEWITKNKDIVL